MNILVIFLTVVHVIVAVFLIVLVLMQKSKDQGVGAAFGGAMTETVFGAGTTTALVRMTIWCACTLLATSLILAVIHARLGVSSGGGGSSLMEGVRPTAPAAAPAAMPGQLPAPAPSTPAPAPATAPATEPKPATPAK